MEHAMDEFKAAMPSFLQGKSSNALTSALDLADALGYIHTNDRKEVVAFLQGGKVDPNDAGFHFHSDKIIGKLKDVGEKLKIKKKKVNDQWDKDRQACKDRQQSLKDSIADNKDAMETLDGEIEDLKKEIAENREHMVKAEDQLKEDQLYLKDLMSQCELRAKDWDQRSAMRTDEIEALDKAIEILNSDEVKDADKVNKRASAALLASKTAPVASKEAHLSAKLPVKAASFLQTRSARTWMKRLQLGSGVSAASKRERIAKMLADSGARLKSTVLANLAIKVKDDPFVKIKDLIQQLIERLVNEAKGESEKKGFCDHELGKSKMDRDNKYSEVKKVNVQIRGLEARKAELEDELETLAADIKDLTANLAEAEKIRKREKEENMDTIEKAKEGEKGVSKALEVLRKFYKKAKTGALLQVSASPVDEDTEGAGFEGSYKGKQDAATGIIGMLEVLESDFARTVKVTTNDEADAAAEFESFSRQSKSDIKAKETKTLLDEQELKATKSNIGTGMEDLQTAQDLLDQALKEIEELKPVCIDSGMSYEERVKRREAEIEALKKALCSLDEEGVEAECA
eukprot:gnl/TRDRNA2_/TRDRNA2_133313_c0_seq1.p1 gnl/TRDRNA2_/TRDRNA2_133313_c0~~gnl/TRDRNA2_/TRDRNA2_133313_c0_seq1.p1  ORF type:complete len:619 (-),score=207.52 gnl/TRDRNA2_/TRDRNA2_133313_c0_seq1:55-1773(-)